MLGLKTLLRLVIAAALITGGLYAVMEFGRPQAGQGAQAELRPVDGVPAQAAKSAARAVPEFRPSMDAVAPTAPAAHPGGDPAGSGTTLQAESAPPAPALADPQPPAAQPGLAAVAPVPSAQDASARDPQTPAPATEAVAGVDPQAEPQQTLPATGALSDPADEPAAAPAPEKPKRTKTAKGGLICTTFKSYNAESGTYRGLDGKVHECKAPPLQ